MLRCSKLTASLWAGKTVLLALTTVLGSWAGAEEPYAPALKGDYPSRVFWGDTHLHTGLSADAVGALGLDDAYRFARGEEVTSSTGQLTQLSRPLDFLVVADHGNNMGAQMVRDRVKVDAQFRESAVGKLWLEAQELGLQAPAVNKERLRNGKLWPGDKNDPAIRLPAFRRSIWQDVTAKADQYNEPGQFTAFIGYEWTGSLGAIHRVVIFKDNAEIANKVLPFTSYDSLNPEDLWDYMANYETDAKGSILAIPHNSNITWSKKMFPVHNWEGQPITSDYAKLRSRWEPLVEVTQIKGDSETHPLTSPDDEFAGFENWNGWAGREVNGLMWNGRRSGSRPADQLPFQYVRPALKLGLQEQAKVGINPFKFGLIGSTDSHTGLTAVDENNFWGKHIGVEPKASRVTAEFAMNNWELNAAGYAAVWARENTRESLFEAMRRREVYASTGPRMTVRFFGGWDYAQADAAASNLAQIGYAGGVPMGSDLTQGPAGQAPTFLIRAVKDPDGANLDRVQVIKGWRNNAGKLLETIHNVALADGRSDGKDGAPPVGNTVDIKNATYSNSIGDPELATVWTDPDFNADQLAFYYVRVIEIPTPRWSAYDAKYYQLKDVPENIPMTTQERAYTSPIWYTPQ